MFVYTLNNYDYNRYLFIMLYIIFQALLPYFDIVVFLACKAKNTSASRAGTQAMMALERTRKKPEPCGDSQAVSTLAWERASLLMEWNLVPLIGGR